MEPHDCVRYKGVAVYIYMQKYISQFSFGLGVFLWLNDEWLSNSLRLALCKLYCQTINSS